jgi:hypothetical protein
MSRLVYILKISSLCFFHRPCLISSSIRRLTTPKSYFAGWGGAMVAKDVASVSDLVVFMKKERS